ncbi:extracellular solute-binding protein [Paenibacillus sp.]|uniref:extracellular solute-binding protein n=1 Tax=Paenibacillus sp. TaxID=58172 RepID=UPI002D331968|nr:extracellular solute-binding protein [Paenibacillus sp.]HZG87936.1 extracellular solute-binding protein [Paenibacillus sp.]
MNRWKRTLLAVSLLALMLATACGTGTDAGNGQTNEGQPQTAEPAPTDAAGASADAPAAEDGPLTKFDPPITVRSAINDNGKDFLSPGDTLESNVWLKGYENELGIKVQYDWIVERANAGNKMNATLASGDLPDIFAVNHSQYKQLLDAGKIADLTEAYEKYGSDLLKEFYNAGGDGLKPVKQDGKLYGLTDYSGTIDAAGMMYIRTDWMKKLNLQAPKTMEDVIAIAKAFTEGDPDGNGQKDTFGLQLNKDLDSGWTIKMNGFANMFHAHPGIWIKDESGKLVYGSVQPEMKQVLAALQELYKAGVIDQEFGTKDVAKASETIMSGKSGMFFGPLASPFAINAMMADANIDWAAYPIPSADDQPAKVNSQILNATVFVVRSDFKHPEALVKMMNFAVEKLYGASAETEAETYLGPSGQGFHVAPVKILKPNKNLGIYQNVSAALAAQDPSSLNREEKSYYDFIQKYRSGERAQWVYERIFGPESSIAVVEHYVDNGLLMLNEFSAPPTATMATKKATLDKLELETFTKIIYGESSVDEFDKFVENWNKLGGQQITEEVNQASNS